MNAIDELRQLLGRPDAPAVGVVTALAAGSVTVATASGPLTAIPEPGLRLGDRVRVHSGRAFPAPLPQRIYPV